MSFFSTETLDRLDIAGQIPSEWVNQLEDTLDYAMDHVGCRKPIHEIINSLALGALGLMVINTVSILPIPIIMPALSCVAKLAVAGAAVWTIFKAVERHASERQQAPAARLDVDPAEQYSKETVDSE